MNANQLKRLDKRNSSMDLIRVVAVFSVLSVHFFLHNGFYHEPVEGMSPIAGLFEYFTTHNAAALHGPIMFVMVTMRTLFSVCVPLFLLLTGYLMSRKQLSKGYYKGIRKTLIIYVIASVLCMIYKSIHQTPEALAAFGNFDIPGMISAIKETQQYRFQDFLLSIFDFSGANYSWYVEMYIGLFLIAPFLNLAYHKLGTQRRKQVLLATCIFMTALPTIFNVFNFQSANWWLTPTIDDHLQKLLPAFWLSMYPITFYFTGCYIREYGIKLRTRSMIAVLAVSLLLFSAFNWFRSYGSGFNQEMYVYWYGIEPYVLATLVFTLLSRVKANNWHPTVRFALWKVSDLALGIYLMSYIYDEMIYEVLVANVPVMVDRLPYYFITVPLSFVCAAVTSWLMNKLETLIIFLYEKIKAFVKQQKEQPNRRRWQDYLFFALLIGGVLFSLWKTRYGFGGSDEAFYLTIPHRLLKGDALFVDEWHLSQMSSFLQLPFMWAYTTFTGSTEGIILAARIFYVFVHAAASGLIYWKLRNYGIISVVGSFLYFIYTPYNIMALSYDSMGVELMVLAGVLLATANYDKKLQLIFSGLCLAGAVLCCPYLAVLYLLYAIGMVVHILLRKKDIRCAVTTKMFAPKTFLFFSVGVGAAAVVFLIFVLTRASIGDIMQNLPHMLEDPEHPSVPFMDKVGTYFNSVFNMHPHFRYGLLAYGVMLLVMIFDKKRRLHRSVYLITTTGVVIFSQILLLPQLGESTYNAIMFPMLFIGVSAYILCKDKPRTVFAALFVPGIIYSLCIHCTSNQGFYVISMAMTVANVASYVFLARLITEMRESPDNITYAVWIKRFSFCFITLMLVLQGAFEIGSKARHVFWENEPATLTEEIQHGAAAGIYTNANRSVEYENYYTDMQQYKKMRSGNILFMSINTWYYLDVEDFDYGTYSAWLSGEKPATLERLKTFYELNPDKQPEYVYVPLNSEWDMNTLKTMATQNGYTIHDLQFGVSFEKEIVK